MQKFLESRSIWKRPFIVKDHNSKSWLFTGIMWSTYGTEDFRSNNETHKSQFFPSLMWLLVTKFMIPCVNYMVRKGFKISKQREWISVPISFILPHLPYTLISLQTSKHTIMLCLNVWKERRAECKGGRSGEGLPLPLVWIF